MPPARVRAPRPHARPPPASADKSTHATRTDTPPTLPPFASADQRERLVHTYGKSCPD